MKRMVEVIHAWESKFLEEGKLVETLATETREQGTVQQRKAECHRGDSHSFLQNLEVSQYVVV